MSVLDVLARVRIVPVVVLDDAGTAERLGDALKAGGLPIAEVTFRTDAAEAALRAMAKDPDLLVGAGTVIRADQVDRAVLAGARFIVSPGLSASVVQRARDYDVPVFPGVATPTDVMTALDLGLSLLKLFPAETLGGPAAVRALSAPFPGVRFVPTGGITAQSMGAYLALPSVVAVGGSWMVAPALVHAGAFDQISALAAHAVAEAASCR